MAAIFLILILLAILLIVFYLSKIDKTWKAEKKNNEETRSEANERISRPERKLHEAEKKRWEDAYWKHQEKRDKSS